MQKVLKKIYICDLDETLYPGSTIRDASRFWLKRGYIGRAAYLKIIWWMALRKLGRLDHEAAFRSGIKLMAGWTEADFTDRCEEVYREVIKPTILPETIKHIQEWLADGQILIATESLQALIVPWQKDFGFLAVLGTEIKVRDGHVTGGLAGPVLRGEAKNAAVLAWATKNKIDLNDCVAVGGRAEDALLFQITGHAIAYKSDAALLELVRGTDWQVIE